MDSIDAIKCFLTCRVGMARDKYKTKLDGRVVCNTYYAVALRYI